MDEANDFVNYNYDFDPKILEDLPPISIQKLNLNYKDFLIQTEPSVWNDSIKTFVTGSGYWREPMKPAPLFKVGDEVEYVGSNGPFFSKGEIGIVIKIRNDGSRYPYNVKFEKHTDDFRLDELKLYKDEGKLEDWL